MGASSASVRRGGVHRHDEPLDAALVGAEAARAPAPPGWPSCARGGRSCCRTRSGPSAPCEAEPATTIRALRARLSSSRACGTDAAVRETVDHVGLGAEVLAGRGERLAGLARGT